MESVRIILLFSLLISCFHVFPQNISSWKGEVDSQWSNYLNWTNGVPCDTVQAILGDNNFIGINQPIISSSSRCKSLILDSIIPLTLIVSNEFYIQGDVNILSSSDTLLHTGGKITVRGNWQNNGTYLTLGTTSQVAFGGINQTLTGLNNLFHKLHINGGSILTLGSNVQVHKLSLNGVLNPNQSPSYYIQADSIIINNEGVLKVTTSTFEENYSAYPICNVGGVVDYASTKTNQTVSSDIVYATLRISGNGIKKLEANLPELLSIEPEAGRIYVNSAVFDLGTYSANRGVNIEGGFFTVANGASLRIGGQTTDYFPKNFRTNSLKDSSTVEYYGGGTQLINPRSYGNLVLSSSSGDAIKILPTTALNIDGDFSIKLLEGSSVSVQVRSRLKIQGNVNIGQGTTLNGGIFQHTVGGSWNNSGFYNASSGTINFYGSNKYIQGRSIFHNLIIAGSYSIKNSSPITTLGKISICDSASLTLQSISSLDSKVIRIEPTGLFENNGTTSVTDSVIMVANDTNTAQLLNTGTIINNGVNCLEKSMLASTGWYFMSFPFDVLATHITDATTNDPLIWGDLSGLADFYVATYDGNARDATGNPNTNGTGNYWISVNPRILLQNRGYIIATEVDRSILFTSAPGEHSLFNTAASIAVNRSTNNASDLNHSWNLLGNPFSTSFDLLHASPEQAPFYVYDGFTYQTIMPGDSYKIQPYSAYFLQANDINPQVLFNASGLGFRSAFQENDFDEIDLYLDDGRYTDRLRIRINEGASIAYERGVDGIKMLSLRSDIPQFYSRLGGLNYSVNTLPPALNGNTIIPLSIYSGKSGNYSIRLSHPEEIIINNQVLLFDSLTGFVINLLEDTIYRYTTSSKGIIHNRFSIVLSHRNITNTNYPNHNTIKLIVTSQQLYFTGLEGKASLVISDLSGRLVGNYSISNYQNLHIRLKGVYLVRISTESQVKQFKIYV